MPQHVADHSLNPFSHIPDLSRRASVKVVAFDNNQATSPGDGLGNGSVVTAHKPKSRSGSIIGAISPIMGTGEED